MSSIVIQRSPSETVYPGQIVNFTIVSGISSSLYASFEWYLNDVLVSTNNNFSLIIQPEIDNYSVYVKVNEYCQVFWYDGEFFGGSFNGNFSGGTFYYGYLNDCEFTQPVSKPKKFYF